MRNLFVVATALVMFAMSAQAATIQQATVTLGGPQLLSTLRVENGPGSTAPIVEVVYNFGGAAGGIATFFTDATPQDGAPGAARANFWVALPLNDPGFFEAWQTSTWSGLNLAAGSQEDFSGLIVKLIADFLPPAVSDGPDATGASLVNGSVTVRWGDGAVATAELLERSWREVQELELSAEAIAVVPLPAAASLYAVALLGFAAAFRRRT